MTGDLMTRADRDTLIKIARQRERVAKSEAKERSTALLADFERQLDRRYSYDENQVWEAAATAAIKAAEDAQTRVAEECERLGIPKDFAPTLHIQWYRKGRNASKEERGEMRRIALREVAAMEQAAKTAIERRSLETQEKIMVGGLTTEDARQFLAEMPTAGSLMPALSVDSIKALIEEAKQ